MSIDRAADLMAVCKLFAANPSHVERATCVHRLVALMLSEAVAAAARRSPPAADERIGRVESWEDGRGPNSNVPIDCCGCGRTDGFCTHPGCAAAGPNPARGSFAGLTRGPDGTLEPAGGVTHAYPADAMPAGLRKACEHRPEAAFGKPVTFHGDTGPIVPTNPTIAAEDSA